MRPFGKVLSHNHRSEVKTEQTWFLVADVDVERQDDDVGEQRRPPVDHKHHHAAQHGSG